MSLSSHQFKSAKLEYNVEMAEGSQLAPYDTFRVRTMHMMIKFVNADSLSGKSPTNAQCQINNGHVTARTISWASIAAATKL